MDKIIRDMGKIVLLIFAFLFSNIHCDSQVENISNKMQLSIIDKKIPSSYFFLLGGFNLENNYKQLRPLIKAIVNKFEIDTIYIDASIADEWIIKEIQNNSKKCKGYMSPQLISVFNKSETSLLIKSLCSVKFVGLQIESSFHHANSVLSSILYKYNYYNYAIKIQDLGNSIENISIYNYSAEGVNCIINYLDSLDGFISSINKQIYLQEDSVYFYSIIESLKISAVLYENNYSEIEFFNQQNKYKLDILNSLFPLTSSKLYITNEINLLKGTHLEQWMKNIFKCDSLTTVHNELKVDLVSILFYSIRSGPYYMYPFSQEDKKKILENKKRKNIIMDLSLIIDDSPYNYFVVSK